MTYYEELGLTPTASADEIRHAYKNLVRILHPDPHSDETLRSLAELQMKRLNAIYAVLSDPAQRRAYDLAFEAAPGEPLRPRAAAPGRGRRGWRGFLLDSSDLRFAAWLAAGCVVLLGIVWLLTESRTPRVLPRRGAGAPPAGPIGVGTPAAPAPSAEEALRKELAQLRRRLDLAEAQRDAARAEATELRFREPAPGPLAKPAPSTRSRPAASVPEPPPPVSDTAAAAEAPSGARLPLPGSPAPFPSTTRDESSSRFAGTWFYTPPRVASAPKSLYPPEYIEVAIVQEAGELRGRYYGRYRVTDRAISPEVIFRFEGRPQQDSAVLEWHGGGGARGEIRLKLLSENSMEVNWSATDLGSTPGLAAGTAVLFRRIE